MTASRQPVPADSTAHIPGQRIFKRGAGYSPPVAHMAVLKFRNRQSKPPKFLDSEVAAPHGCPYEWRRGPPTTLQELGKTRYRGRC